MAWGSSLGPLRRAVLSIKVDGGRGDFRKRDKAYYARGRRGGFGLECCPAGCHLCCVRRARDGLVGYFLRRAGSLGHPHSSLLGRWKAFPRAGPCPGRGGRVGIAWAIASCRRYLVEADADDVCRQRALGTLEDSKDDRWPLLYRVMTGSLAGDGRREGRSPEVLRAAQPTAGRTAGVPGAGLVELDSSRAGRATMLSPRHGSAIGPTALCCWRRFHRGPARDT